MRMLTDNAFAVAVIAVAAALALVLIYRMYVNAVLKTDRRDDSDPVHTERIANAIRPGRAFEWRSRRR